MVSWSYLFDINTSFPRWKMCIKRGMDHFVGRPVEAGNREGSLCAGRYSQPSQQVGNVYLDCARAEEQVLGDFAIGGADGQFSEHVLFAAGEAVGGHGGFSGQPTD